MTLDPDLPPTDDELAVAAVVDGDATAEQRRRVARDPGLVAQVRAAEQARAALAAPVPSPGEDVLAAIRARAVEVGTAPAEGDVADEAPAPATAPVPDVEATPARPRTTSSADELAARRARRSRRLPPLPAVAAVVLVLLLGGIALLVTDDRGSDDQSADAATAADDAGGASDSGGTDAGGDETMAAEAADGAGSPEADGPAAAFRDDLLARAATSYVDEEALFEALRTVDPTTLDLTASRSAATTTAPAPAGGEQGEASTTTGPVIGAADGRRLAEDSEVQRCDSVLRSAEDGIGPATAATFVAVDGIPVLVLSNPVEATDDTPATTRLTVLNAVDCSPRGAVQR